MDEAQALINSLGEQTVAYIGKDHLKSLTVYPTGTGSVEVEICLLDNSWQLQSHVVDVMIDIRQMFIDEVSIDYRFIEEDDQTLTAAAERSSYCYA